MAQDVTIAGASYTDVPGIQVPLTGGGGNALFLDSTSYRTAADQDVIDAGKADSSHTHGASDITSGVLVIDRGGTGIAGGLVGTRGVLWGYESERPLNPVVGQIFFKVT